MTNPQVDAFEKHIRAKLPTYDTPDQAAEALRTEYTNIGFLLTEELEHALSQALERVVASLEDVEILRRHSLAKDWIKWYNGPAPKDLHWPALEGYLSNTKGWDEETINSIDESSSEIVSLLADPSCSSFHHRGLVVGHVQSGKTANMTAVIAKAVDAGYNLIVLLAGVTNKLRAQTQRRIESDIVNRHRHLWQLYTTKEENGDYVFPANGSFIMPTPGQAQLVVIKKVASRLEAFRRTITDDRGKPRTPLAIQRNLKVLLIDDECDQASVNSSDSDLDPTTINNEIRTIIRDLPAVTYVGYTATPFANVFINPYPLTKNILDDLYPEDFITALPRSKGYFGAREVFGFDPENAEEETPEEAGRNMLRDIPKDTLDLLRPRRIKDKDSFTPQLTNELEEALLWYLISCAIRRIRGQGNEHMTMLVHTSPHVVQHTRMHVLIKKWVEDNQLDLEQGIGKTYAKLWKVFETETRKVPLEIDITENTSEKLLPALQEVLQTLEIVVENGESFERLNYTDKPKTYIVVGGTVLARGLTLEGLSVSFFLRASLQYDTLLQMGRWFGYRKGYEDLPRLWTTSELSANFRALAKIEEEIRDDIKTYQEHNVTPAQFAVRVRSIPGMAITATSKMRHAYRTDISFKGRHIQTIRFDHQNSKIVANNWSAASRLVDEAMELGHNDFISERKSLITGVPLDTIRKFLVSYDICSQHMDLKKEMLLKYMDGAQSDLKLWNIGIITPNSQRTSQNKLGKLGYVSTTLRSQLSGEREYADIKALMSKNDILIDAKNKVSPKEKWTILKSCRPKTPLLLLYAIDRHSPSNTESEARINLDAVGDLIGIGIVFPGKTDEAGEYLAVMLDVPVPEETEEEQEELIAVRESTTHE